MPVKVGEQYKNKHTDEIVTIVDREELPSSRGQVFGGEIHSGWVVQYDEDNGRCEENMFLNYWELVEGD